MGTRGALGVRIDGQEKVAYNHFDSYPSGLGADIVEALKGGLLDDPKFREDATNLTVIDGKTPPTPEQIEHLKPYTNLGVSEQSTSD